jgi:hypothetical protein
MSKTVTRVAAAAVAILILVAGLSYAATRTTTYRSTATLLLAPKPGTPSTVLSSLLDSFQRSGTAGTYVELISSKDTLSRAGVSGITVSVRSVPDARTINIEADGPQNAVQPGLRGVIRATQARESELGDVWRSQVLGSPSPPEASGVSKKALIAATVLLALLGALFVVVVMRRYRFVATGGFDEPPELSAGSGVPGAGGGGVPLGSVRATRAEIEQPAEVLVHFELESFHFVKASATTMLLQVDGYWRSGHPRDLEEPTLLLHDGTRMHALAPLASPPTGTAHAGPETPLWRGSYAAPVGIFERHERIAMRAGSGVVVGLPEPVEQGLLAGGEGPGSMNGGAHDDHHHDAHDAHADAFVDEHDGGDAAEPGDAEEPTADDASRAPEQS